MDIPTTYIQLISSISFIHTKLEKYIESSIDNAGLDITKTRAMILSQIRFKGRVNQKTIADLNNISPQAVHRHINILEDKKYIIRRICKKDTREQNFILTNTGKVLIDKSQKVFIRSIKDFFKDLDEGEINTLIKILSKVKDFNIKKKILN